MPVLALPAPRVLLPYRHLKWRAIVAGNLACVVPGAVVALVLGYDGGHPAPALVLAGLVLAAALIGSFVAARIRTEMRPDGIVSHWTQRIGTTTVPTARVKQAVLRTVHNVDGITTNRHLFLLDASGRTLFRMCDRWWRPGDIAALTHHFEVPLVAETEPVHLAELRRSVPDQLLWNERHRMGVALLKTTGGFAACIVIAALCVAAL